MHVIQGGWVGQTYALATSNDAGGKKSRIRRSKEERKTMVESFVKKYQKSNNGNFPSLNLTHKEVGGSFYTVREIVREIIQENRVLAPPKRSLDRQMPSGPKERHTLESSPVEHENDLLVSAEFHIVTSNLPNQSPTSNGELMSSSSSQLNGPELDDKVSEESSVGHPVPNHYQDTMIEVSESGKQASPPWRDKLEHEKIVNESEGLEENTDSDKPLMTTSVPINQVNSESRLQSSNKIHDSPRTQGHSDGQYLNNNEQMVEKLDGAEKQPYMESVDMEILSKENVGLQDKEVLLVATLDPSSVAESFPVVAVSRTVVDLDGESGELHEAAESSKDVTNKSEKIASTESNSDVVNAKDEEKLKEVALKLKYEYKDNEVAQTLHEPSPSEDSKLSTTLSPSGLNNGGADDPASKSSLPNETKVSSSTIHSVSESPSKVRIGSNSQDKHGLKKMDRINLGTWKGASEKSSKPQSNPVLALVKAFLSAFVKLWTQ